MSEFTYTSRQILLLILIPTLSFTLSCNAIFNAGSGESIPGSLGDVSIESLFGSSEFEVQSVKSDEDQTLEEGPTSVSISGGTWNEEVMIGHQDHQQDENLIHGEIKTVLANGESLDKAAMNQPYQIAVKYERQLAREELAVEISVDGGQTWKTTEVKEVSFDAESGKTLVKFDVQEPSFQYKVKVVEVSDTVADGDNASEENTDDTTNNPPPGSEDPSLQTPTAVQATEGDAIALQVELPDGYDPELTTWTWEQTDGPTAVLSDATIAQPTATLPNVSNSTELTFIVTITDPAMGSVSRTVIVNMTASDSPPVAAAGADQNVNGGVVVNLDASTSSDPENSDLIYQWTQTSGMPMVTLQDDGTATPSFTAPNQSTTLSFQVKVTDDGGADSVDEVDINITATGPATNGPAGAPVDITGLQSTALAGGVSLAWTRAAGGTMGYLIVRKKGAAVDAAPTNGQSYEVGEDMGSGNTVVSINNASEFVDSGAAAGGTWHYKVFSYNRTLDYSPGVSSAGDTSTSIGGHRYYRLVINSVDDNSFGSRYTSIDYINLIVDGTLLNPNLTSNTGAIGDYSNVTVSASSGNASAYQAFRAPGSWQSADNEFNNTAPYNAVVADSVWIQIDFGAGNAPLLEGVKMDCLIFGEPDVFYFQYSDNGAAWTNVSGGAFIDCLSINSLYEWTPPAPTNLVYSGTNTSVEISFDNPTGNLDSGYLIARGAAPLAFQPTQGSGHVVGAAGADEILQVDATLTESDAGLTVGNAYHYGLWSYSASNNYSAPTYFIARPSPANRPQNVTITAAANQVTVDWDNGGGAETSYLLVAGIGQDAMFAPEDGSSYIVGNVPGGEVIYAGAGTNFVHTGLTDGQAYHYQLWSLTADQTYSKPAAKITAISGLCPGVLNGGACWVEGVAGSSCQSTCTNVGKSFNTTAHEARFPSDNNSHSTDCRNLMAAIGITVPGSNQSNNATSSTLCGYEPGVRSLFRASLTNDGSETVAGLKPVCPCE